MKKISVIVLALVMAFSNLAYADVVSQESITGFIQSEIAEKIEDSIILMIGNAEGYINNSRIKIDQDDPSVKPLIIDDITLVPLRFIAENFGMTVIFNETTSEIEVENEDFELKLSADKKEYSINGEEKAFETPVIVKSGRTLVPLRDLVEFFGKSLFWDDSGLIIISNEEKTFTPKIIEPIVNALSYRWGNVYLGGNGFVTGMAIHPKNPDIIYARTDIGGAYRWNPRSETWEPMNDWLSYNNQNLYGVDGIAIDPNDENVVYMALGGYWYERPHDVLKSTDRGMTWKSTNFTGTFGSNHAGEWGAQRVCGECIAVDPNNSNIVFVGTRLEGLFRSTDAGESWERVNDVTPGTPYRGIRVVRYDEFSPVVEGKTSVLYVGTNGDGMFVSKDGGDSFLHMEGSPADIKRMDIGSNSVAYVATGDVPQGGLTMEGNGVYKIVKDKWIEISPKKGEWQGTIAVCPTNPDYVIASEQKWSSNDYYITKDGGKNWTYAGRTHLPAIMLFNYAKPTEGWYTHGFGIFRCTDMFADELIWEETSKGVEELCLVQTVSPPKGPQILSAVMDKGLMISTDLTALAARGDNPESNATNSIDFCESDPNLVLRASVHDTHQLTTQSFVSASYDGGLTWTQVATVEGTLMSISVAPTKQPNGLPIVTGLKAKGNPIRSLDFGKTWESTEGGPRDMHDTWYSVRNSTMASDRVTANLFYALDYRVGTLFTSTDGGVNWLETSSVPMPADRRNVRWMKAVPGLKGNIWIASWENGLLASEDSGKTFKPLPNVQKAVLFGFGKNAPGKTFPTAFVYGTANNEEGIFRSDDMGKTWVRINDNSHKIGNRPVDMTGDRQTYGKVYIGTEGRGTFYGELLDTDDVPPKITINQTNTLPEEGVGYAVRDEEFLVTGTVSETAEVKVNGITAEVDNNNFYSCKLKLTEGMNEITVNAKDPFNNRAAPKTIKVNYIPEYIGITLLKNELYTQKESAVISGKTNTPCQLLINGSPVDLDSENVFNYNMQLSEGENDITIVASQGGYTTKPMDVKIIKDNTAPTIEIDEESVSTNQPFYIITGNVSEGASIKVNGETGLTQDDLSFSQFVQLNLGTNTVAIEAVDFAGNKSEKLTMSISYAKDAKTEAREELVESRRVKTLTLDGILDEKEWSLDYVMGKLGEGNPNNFVRFDSLWDDENLYVAAKVVDNYIYGNLSTVYLGDAIEIYIDALLTKAVKYDTGGRQFFFGVDWTFAGSSQSKEGVEFAQKRTSDGYVMEMKIPWKNLNLTPKAGLKIGFDIDNTDNDNGSDSERHSVIIWHGTGDNWQSMANYGELILVSEDGEEN